MRVLSLPDDENLPHKTVELVASDNEIEIVVEHTGAITACAAAAALSQPVQSQPVRSRSC